MSRTITNSKSSLPVLQPLESSKLFCNAVVGEPQLPEPYQGAGLWLLNTKNMTVAWMNEAMEETYGPVNSVVGENCFRAFRGRDSRCPDCLPTQAAESGNIVTGYIQRTTLDGVNRFYQLVEAPLMDEKNQVTRVLEIVLDITEKRRMEDALEASEREYRALFEHAGTAVAVSDPKGTVLKVNHAFVELSGYSKEEIEGKMTYDQFVHSKDLERIEEYSKIRWSGSQAPDAYEFTFVAKNKSEKLVNIYVSTLPNGQQIVSLVDLSERKALEKEVRNKEQFLANILRHSVEAIVAMDTNDVIRSWNHGAELIFGYKAKEILGKKFPVLLAPTFRRSRKLRTINKKYESDGFIRNSEVEGIKKDGKKFVAQVTRTAIFDENGKDLGSSAIVRDITESRKLEYRMVQQEKMAALGEMAASLAHEIKNPLNSMVINLEVLRSHFGDLPGAKQDRLNRYLDVLSAEVQRLDKVMRGVLDFSRPIEGAFSPVEISRTLQNTIDLVAAQARQNKIKMMVQMEKNLPMVEGAEDYLKQVFLNLILNAFQAMPSGGKLTVRAERERSAAIRIEISDTGTGIPRQNFHRIFDLHFSTKDKGSGLGLPLAKRLIDAHGGSISFKSRIHHGTTFSIVLPAI